MADLAVPLREGVRPTLGIFGLTGCAGDQLAVLDCEDELLALMERVDVRDFLLASSRNDEASPLDVALVEGAVLSRRDEEALRRIRARSRVLVALGTCAVWGGIAALDRRVDRDALLRDLYGEHGLGYDALPARALHAVVEVDAEIPGCPVEKGELLQAIAALLHGDPPQPFTYPVCAECRRREAVCLLHVDPGIVCCGPLTAAGCAARCPASGVGCRGCRGPARDANLPAALAVYAQRGVPRQALLDRLATFAPVVAAPDGTTAWGRP
jgi:coenzyme F420-reducing hydrogenase gamma subunit